MLNYILKNAYLVAQEKTCDIAVRSGTFHYLQGTEASDGDEILDLAGRMVIRGYCDLHTHLDKALVNARVKNRSGTLEEAIRLMASYKSAMTDRDILERAETVLEMCFRNGTRYLRTHVDVDEGIGIRSVQVLKELQQKYRDRIKLQIGDCGASRKLCRTGPSHGGRSRPGGRYPGHGKGPPEAYRHDL